MPAPVIAFESAEPSNKRAEQYLVQFREIYTALRDDLRQRGVYTEQPQLGIFGQLFQVVLDLKDHYERRTAMAERTLRYLIASEVLTDDLRQRALNVLVGKEKVTRDPKILSAHESTMIQQYRAMDAQGRQMLRTLFDRLAATQPISEESSK